MTKAKTDTAKKFSRQPDKKTGLVGLIEGAVFSKYYALVSLLILLATVVFWTLKSAGLQAGNADQLVNPYLFENAHTFNEASLPGAHTFLLKWPLFFLIKLFGFTSAAYLAVTLFVVVVTIAGLAYILYRIDRRPLVFGTLCLALASVLLLVPAQAYAGALLPVNMAMLATRNLEYLLYVLSLVLLIRSPGLRSLGFWLSVVCLALLIATDRLFLATSVGGALLSLVAYSLARRWKMVSLSASWLVASVMAALGAAGILGLLQASKITHVASQAGAGPYDLAQSAHDTVLGGLYAVLGLLTNFGANPAYDATTVRSIPHQMSESLTHVGAPVYIINALFLLAGGLGAVALVWASVRHHRAYQNDEDDRLDPEHILSTTLVWSTLAAVVAFVATNHYYAVDARYLGIALFAAFISAAVFIRQRSFSPLRVVFAGAIVLIVMPLGVLAANKTYSDQRAALTSVEARNSLIAQAMSHHHSDVLVGDYWRVLPIKQAAGKDLIVTPLDNCTHTRQALSSRAWQPDLRKHSFTYLLTLDKGLTDYPACTLQQVVSAYGRPNASVTITGTLSQPKEQLLFYDHGVRKVPPITASRAYKPATVVPISLGEFPWAVCNKPTILNVVAHQDDDLLFMSPDLTHDIKAGRCVRTVYVTAGDGGSDQFYWLGREQGSEAAYSKMLGTNSLWVHRIVQLDSKQYVTLATPLDNTNVALVFMHLPDGNLKGQGFAASNHESLESLRAGKISLIRAVDKQSAYTSDQLAGALTSLMHFFQPTEIRTQANYVSRQYPDHSDHMAVGRYTQRAYAQYEAQRFEGRVTIPIKYYVGYPIHERPANITGVDLTEKEAAYFAYASYDSAVCHSLKQCEEASTLGLYLKRQYTNPY